MTDRKYQNTFVVDQIKELRTNISALTDGLDQFEKE